VKNSFLELLTLLNDQGKIIPLRVEQRIKLVKMLLHQTLEKFDSSLLICPGEEGAVQWEVIYSRLWSDLAATCPDLLHLRERRFSLPSERRNKSRLDTKVFTFTKLITLDTDCFLDSG